QRRDPQRAQEAARLPGLRRSVHAAITARRDDGLVRGGMRCLLHVWSTPRGRPGRDVVQRWRGPAGSGPDRRTSLMATVSGSGTTNAVVLRDSILRKCRESMATKEQFFTEQAERIASCAAALARAFDGGGRLFVMGNGGSSCDAAHVAVEFMH